MDQLKKSVSLILMNFILISNAWTATLKGQVGEVYIYNWSEFMPEKVIDLFEQETKIKVHYSTYDNNESMLAKLKLLKNQKKNSYDIVFPSSYVMKKFISEDLLEKLDKSKLSNFKNLDPSLLNKNFDPENQYSLPYLWGMTILTYNQNIIKTPIESWAQLWRKDLKKQILLLNDYREVFFIALKVLGYSGNSKNPEEIQKAFELLLTLLPNIRTFESQSPKTAFLSGEVSVGGIWTGEHFMAAQEERKLKGIIPKEGAIFFVDNICLTKNSRQKENAYKFINFILRPDIAKIIAEEIGYSTPNLEAKKILSEKFKNNPLMYPNSKILEKGEFQEDIGKASLIYEKYWEKLRLKMVNQG
jgi:spermidine/putrescine transport system substrate-binding protein